MLVSIIQFKKKKKKGCNLISQNSKPFQVYLLLTVSDISKIVYKVLLIKIQLIFYIKK